MEFYDARGRGEERNDIGTGYLVIETAFTAVQWIMRSMPHSTDGHQHHIQPHHCYFGILALESLITGDPLVSPAR